MIAESHTPDQRPGNFRWTICALIFFATTINYLDRAVISLLKSTLERQFHWSETDYANIVIAFQVSYAIGLAAAGRLIDRLGARRGYALSLALWSVASLAHALVTSTLGFIWARLFLGITEAGNFPSAIKTVAEWFPKKERALATGIFNAGTNCGAILAPLVVPFIATKWGWPAAFVVTGAVGFLWLIAWWIVYRAPEQHPRVKPAELAHIHSDAPQTVDSAGAAPIPWTRLLAYRQTWAIFFGKFLTDPVWWFYLFWLPAFLKAQYKMEGTAVAWPVALVYIMAAIGSVAGGWLPLKLIQRGRSVFQARKSSMFVYALLALPVISTLYFGSRNVWAAVFLIGVAAAAHQAWSANIYTVASDLFPKRVVGSVTGIGGMAGALGGILIAVLAGKLFDHYKALGALETGYQILFVICGCAYLTAWLIMHALVPRPREVEA